jgi:hypothetical protein
VLQQKSDSRHEPTIYHYTLIRKWQVSPIILAVYYFTLLPVIFLLYHSWNSFIYIPIGCILVLCIHVLVGKIALSAVQAGSRSPWSFRWGWLWTGFFPVQYGSMQTFRLVQWHQVFIGTAMIGVLIPWSPKPLTLSMAILHLWFMLPRMAIQLGMHRFAPEGWVKLERTGISYYRS